MSHETKHKSKHIVFTFQDGTKAEYPSGTTAKEIIAERFPHLAKTAIVAKVGQKFLDLSRPIEPVQGSGDLEFKPLTFEDAEGKKVFWHSTNHVMAQAIKRLWPEVKLGIGPAIEEGFYYDYERDQPFMPDELVKIEKEMKNIVGANFEVSRNELKKAEALEFNKKNNEPYRVELVQELQDEHIPFYTQGEFTDMCTGPHVPRTGMIKAFKLLKVSGAYWRGDIRNKQLQRIYGISFPERQMLDDYIKMREEAEKRDHRKIGKGLELFSIHEEGPGFPFFLPKGVVLKNELLLFSRQEHYKKNYVEIQTPIILSKKLWETSGHWENYRQNMYTTAIDNMDYAIKPMNCPGAMLVYKEKVRSYRDLPLRLGEYGIVHRHELSGVLAGLFRVRVFTQDDAHIFVAPKQLKDEIVNVIDIVDHFYRVFGFSYHVELSTRPEKSIGTDEMWENAEGSLKTALETRNMKYKINEGDGAFYGPKIDFHIKDCIGRTWQCATVQVDMAQPERFDLYYVGEDNAKHRPIVVHRVVYGSVERFLGILIEHYAGKFPLWLAPVQAKIVTVADRFNEHAALVLAQLKDAGIRAELDDRAESVSYKVRDAQMQKIPLILTIGDKEVAAGTVAIRTLDGKVKFGVRIDEFIAAVKEAVNTKAHNIAV